jgi:hypothetical protein
MFVNSLFLKKYYHKLYQFYKFCTYQVVVGNHQEFDFSTEFFEQYFNILENTVKFMIMLILSKGDNEIKVAVAADILSLVTSRWGLR